MNGFLIGPAPLEYELESGGPGLEVRVLVPVHPCDSGGTRVPAGSSNLRIVAPIVCPGEEVSARQVEADAADAVQARDSGKKVGINPVAQGNLPEFGVASVLTENAAGPEAARSAVPGVVVAQRLLFVLGNSALIVGTCVLPEESLL